MIICWAASKSCSGSFMFEASDPSRSTRLWRNWSSPWSFWQGTSLHWLWNDPDSLPVLLLDVCFMSLSPSVSKQSNGRLRGLLFSQRPPAAIDNLSDSFVSLLSPRIRWFSTLLKRKLYYNDINCGVLSTTPLKLWYIEI